MAVEQLDTMDKTKEKPLGPSLILYTRSNSKWSIQLNVKP